MQLDGAGLRAGADRALDHEQVLDHAGVVRVGVPRGARAVDRVELERPAARGGGEQAPDLAGLRAAHGRLLGGAHDRTSGRSSSTSRPKGTRRAAAIAHSVSTLGLPLPDSSWASVDLPEAGGAARARRA